jgi:Protein of unknown function (DUF2637)
MSSSELGASGGPLGSIPTARAAVDEQPQGTEDQPDRQKAQKAERRRKQVTYAGYGLLVVVVAIAAAMSWQGLIGFGDTVLKLKAPWVYGVPVSLDVAAMLCGTLALRSVVSNDSAAGPRLLTFLLVTGSAAANYWHADHLGKDGNTPAAMYFGGMSILSWWLWDVVLRQIRRSMLREMGAVERPLPRFRLIRWLRYPKETFAAWSESVRYGLSTPDEALGRIRAAEQAVAQERELRELERLERLPDGISKREAVQMAFKALGELDVPAAVAWCSERGVEVNLSYGYEIARRTEPRALEAVS